MDMIRLETLLEMISADVWIEEQKLKDHDVRLPLQMPTFTERSSIVEDLMHRVAVEGNIIRFDRAGNVPDEIPAFNYLLVCNEVMMSDFIDGVSRPESVKWEIHGVQSFSELDAFLNQTDFMCGFFVYVRCRFQYEKAFCRYAFQRPEEEKIYTNEWGFYYPNEIFADEWGRDLSYRYFFEIVGLCEFHTGQEVFCALLNSSDDLYHELEGRLCDIEIGEDDAWEERGTILFDGADYTYRIWGNRKGISYELRDAEGRQYCSPRHCFLDFPCNSTEDCTLCPYQ